MNNSSHIHDLCHFLDNSPVNFLAAKTLRAALGAAGFVELPMEDMWDLVPGGKYLVTKNDSAVFAFVVGTAAPSAASFHIISAHSDSPGFRIKPNCEMVSDGGIVRLNTEVYGGPILYTWFDRPLSLAGRVILRSGNPLEPQATTVRFDSPLLTIPHLAIHFNRSVNDGNPLSRQNDMLPVLGRLPQGQQARGWVTRMVADELGVDVEDILDFDLFLYDTTPATLWGPDAEFISSGRLDDLSMVHAGLTAMLETADRDTEATRVLAIFDNEETGSGTKQGAASPMLDYILRRINVCMHGTEEDYMRAVARSFMISADNAHGFHPNYPSKYDPTNHPVLGDGPCIKINANCKYMTDADSAAVFATLCREAEVPFQYFVNHSDIAGGSTLGNILTSQIPLRGVDMGAPLWAMHSARETGAVADHLATIAVFSYFYGL